MNFVNERERSRLPFANGSNEIDIEVNPMLQRREENRHDFSHREALRRSAYNNLVKQGARMQKQAARSQGQLVDLEIGIMCLVNMNEYDRVKGEARTLTTVVVESSYRGFYKLACKEVC